MFESTKFSFVETSSLKFDNICHMIVTWTITNEFSNTLEKETDNDNKKVFALFAK